MVTDDVFTALLMKRKGIFKSFEIETFQFQDRRLEREGLEQLKPEYIHCVQKRLKKSKLVKKQENGISALN